MNTLKTLAVVAMLSATPAAAETVRSPERERVVLTCGVVAFAAAAAIAATGGAAIGALALAPVVPMICDKNMARKEAAG